MLSDTIIEIAAFGDIKKKYSVNFLFRHTMTEKKSYKTRIFLAEDNPVNPKMAYRAYQGRIPG